MRIVNLSSGSRGNSTYIEYNQTKMLLDVGLTEKKIKEELSEINVNLSDISAVIITHEHSDHIKALKTLAEKYDMDFYLKKELAELPLVADINFKEGKLHTFENNPFNVGEFVVYPFDISHDAVAPVGYVINVFKSSSKVGFVTDLGIVTESVKQALGGVKVVYIESNYDKNMLLGGKYPPILKKRVAGNKGHLSNEQSLELAKYLYEKGAKCFVLSHISENNNTYQEAYLNYANYFESQNIKLDQDVFIRISHQQKRGNNIILKEEFYGE